MTPLKFLAGYSLVLQEQVHVLINQGRLGEYLSSRYPITEHSVQTDKLLYQYVTTIKQEYLKNAPVIDKVSYDSKLDVVHHALGLHTAVSRVQGQKLKAKKEIRIASLFKQVPPEFLKMIVVHELAHLREQQHNKAFYQLCQHMEPNYHQLEFDLRLLLTHQDLMQPKTI
ncbi:YgjP-like metallopeptidase domain-containing protein [Agitococcus lubricus]|uniref:YgjP-like metallopeptidase domain-containing protein n=1 Tax=Agitococcus lubricus TaxID=1077255 RepID=UPI000D31266C